VEYASIIVPVIILGGLGAVFGIGLGIASRKFAVQVDRRVGWIEEVLPSAGCGACGYAGCRRYAEAVVAGEADTTRCVPGGQAAADAIAAILGIESTQVARTVAKIMCHGRRTVAVENFLYSGIADCRAAALLHGGSKGCEYGCLALGTCATVCPFGAIDHRGPGEIPCIDPNTCTSCGVCVRECPVSIIRIVPAGAHVHVVCSSRAKAKEVKRVCQVGCIGCGACKKVCPEDAVVLENNLAAIIYDKCTECGLCIEKCPTNAIEGIPDQKRAAA
jgi:Na+-translocating ferredoxin:NAD+ oxidoreductase RNF subunit RnfB